jgi:adenylate kinase
LDKLLHKNGEKVDIVFYLKVSKHIARERMVNRVVCPKCKRSYSLKFLTPAKTKKCLVDGASLVKRLDDDLSKFDTRLEIYNLQTKLILQHYKHVVVEIDANSSDEVA